MVKHKLYFTLIFLTRLTSIYTNDFYAKFHQKDYKMDFQRLELINYNKSIFNDFKTKTFKYNRTFTAANMTFNTKVALGAELEAAVQFYKFLSNEYRELRGTNFQVNYCKSMQENIVGLQNELKCGNFTDCHVVKGVTYEICNVYLDESRFPPLIPSGEYKFQIDGIYRNEKIVTFDLYIKIYRPVARVAKKVNIV